MKSDDQHEGDSAHHRGSWLGSPIGLRAVWAAALIAIGVPSWAQQQAPVTDDQRVGGTGGAAGAGAREGTLLTTAIELEQTFSDMRNRPVLPNGIESITMIQPSLRLSSRSGRVQGYINYTGTYYYRTGREDSTGAEWENYLDAAILAEAVPNWAYMDVRASISQQAISAFGQPVGDGALANDNRSETRTLWLSPYLTGLFGGVANYEVRVVGSKSNTRASSGGLDPPDSTYGAGLVSLSSEGRRQFGWRLAARRERVEYSDSQQPTTTDRALGAIVYTPNVDLRLTVSAGAEAADIGGPVRQAYENYGLRVEWTPSPRTSVSATAEERYFGRGHNISIQHRSAQSAFTYTDIRDVNDGTDPFNLGQPTTLYNLLFQQFAAIQPDPGLREQLVLDYINAIGRNPNEVVYGGTLVQGITVERNQNLGWALQGRRTTLTVQAFRTESERIDPGAASVPGGNEIVIQTGYNAGLSYRLTPTAAAMLFGSRLMTQPTPTRSGTDEKRVSLALTSQLGRRTTGALGASYTAYNSANDPYREAQITVRLRLEF